MRKGLLVILISIILCISLLNAVSLNSSSNPVGWSNDIRLTNNTNSSTLPVIGVWENYIHVFWCEREPEPPTTTRDIFYKRSSNGGKTWDNPINLIYAPYDSISPSIAINQSTIHMVWEDHRLGDSAIFYTHSEDNGENWEIEKNISIPSSWVQEPDISVNGNYIYVTYISDVEDTDGNPDGQVFLTKSEDNGKNWTPPKRLISTIRDSSHPAIAVNGSNLHIVWMDHYDKFGTGTMGAIFYINSSDDGLTWSEDLNLTPMNLDSDYPYIAVNGTTIHVVYSKEIAGLWQGYYRRSENNGITWNEDIKILNSSNDIRISGLSIEESELHVAGGDIYISDKEIYYVKGNNNGQNWETQIRMTYSPEDSIVVKIANYERMVHIVWQDYRDGSLDIYYKHYPVPFPPTNLTIDKRFGDDLILNWEHPKNSPSTIWYYHIYRSTTWDGFDLSTPWVNTSIQPDPLGGITPLRTSWNLTGALLDESTSYFYIVRAIDGEGWNDTNTNIVGKYVIPMKKGWNMISLPLAQRNTTVSNVLQTIDGNYNVIWIFDAKEDRWRSSATDLTDINRTMGLWLNMKNSCNLSIIGAVPESTDIALYEGWNLVGFPSLATNSPNVALNGIGWQAVQHYDAYDLNDPWKHNSTKKPDWLNELKEMQPGCGYWVYVTINDTWVRTRVVEDNKMVIWRVHSLEQEGISHDNYEPLTHNPIDTDEDNYKEIDVVPEEPITKNEDNRLDFSFIPLIILIAFIFAEIIILHKRRR